MAAGRRRDEPREALPRSRLNPFAFELAADSQALQKLRDKSYARRRWQYVNMIVPSAEQQLQRRPSGGGGGELGQEAVAALYNSTAVQHLEHHPSRH